MADNVKIDHTTDSDGRRVETRVYEVENNGKKERVIETHIEQIPMMMAERVVEEIAPVVTTRKKETYRDGKVVDTVLEELDHGTMKMAEVKPQSQGSILTKDDLMNVIREVMNSGVASKTSQPAPVKVPMVTPAVKNKIWEIAEIGAYIILSGELACSLYYLVLKNWL